MGVSFLTKEGINESIFSSTFPKIPEKEIFRENIIKSISDTFSEVNTRIILEGINSTGKTILLSQYARKFANQCAAFFVGEDYWSSSVRLFLSDMCQQLSYIVSDRMKSAIQKVDIGSLQEHELVMLFGRLHADLCKQAMAGKGPFYIIVDGIERIKNNTAEDDILRLIPAGNEHGVYVLLSSQKGLDHGIKATSMQVPFFSKLEIEVILGEFLEQDEIEYVYNTCDGMPGYISELYRQFKANGRKEDILENLPNNFSNLIEQTWAQYQDKDEEFFELLSLITFSNQGFSRREVATILNIPEMDIIQHIEKTGFIFEENNKIIVLDAYKLFLKQKLSDYKTPTIQKLIDFYKGDPKDQNAIIYLPELYSEGDQYKSLVNLIDIQNISETLQNTQQISIVRKNIRILSKMASEKKDWKHLAWSSLTEAVFTQLVITKPALESQIKALLSLERYEEALKLTLSCILPEDRLILLSLICSYMKKNGLDITQDIIASVDECINLMDNTSQLNDELIDKLLDISSNLFTIDTDLSFKLLQRIALHTGENIEKDRFMDYMLLRLLFKVDRDTEDVNPIKEKIGSEEINEFINVISESITKDIEQVFKQTNNIKDTSAQLFYLQNWCEINKTDSNSYKIIEKAIDIMTESNDYTPTQLHLRKFAAPLIYSDKLEEVKRLISRIQNLQATVIKNPVEEYALLELTLSEIERKWSVDLALERFYKVYVELDEINELDSKCMVILHLLEHTRDILNDEGLEKELRDLLIVEFGKLVRASADNFRISEKILVKLAKTDKDMAVLFASKLNTEQRRYLAYNEIIQSELKNKDVDFEFISKLLKKIEDPKFRDGSFIRLLRKASNNNIKADDKVINSFFGKIREINSIIGKALAFAYYIQWIHSKNPLKAESAYKELKVNLEQIDSIDDRIRFGFQFVEIIGEVNKKFAAELYLLIINKYMNSNFGDKRLDNTFIKTCELLIRMIPDLIKSKDYELKINQIKKFILSIPSPYQQCMLLSSLALRCYIHGLNTVFNDLVEKCIDILEQCKDPEVVSQIIVEISPSLYEYEESLYVEKLNCLINELDQENSIENVIKFIISKRPPEDPIDLSLFNHKINYAGAMKICKLIDLLKRDAAIHAMITCLVDALVEPSPGNKIKSRLQEKQLLTVTEKLVGTINEKLPDSKNIVHKGYVIASFGQLTRLRDTASHRANKRWKELVPSRHELKNEAMNIANISDKVFVLTSLGKNAVDIEEDFAVQLIKDAEANVNLINNPYDRAERYGLVAEAYRLTSNNRAAKFLLEQAMTTAKICSNEQGRDQLLGGIVELAHTIDPSLANSYASSIDSSISLRNFNDKVVELTLHSDPKKVDNYKKIDTQRMLPIVFNRLLKSLCSGRGTIQHSEVCGKWLDYSVGHNFQTIILGINWYVENSLATNQSRKNSELEELYQGVIQLLDFIKMVQVSIFEDLAITKEMNNFYQVIVEPNLYNFGLNEQGEALGFLKNWIRENVKDEIKIYDPYFNEEQLSLLKYIPTEARVTIYTTASTAELEGFQERYKNFWSKICDQVPPETNFYVYATDSGKTPLHDRYILTNTSGLNLGTSLNGYGSKFSTIRIMDVEEKSKVENELIIPLILKPPLEYKGQRVKMQMFSLNY
ncbi:TPA: ATP-binding protein [Bacillus thuringiensis]|uniref:ATP-binding protein n=1 Tax=Bacillus thuringiensis TaxID=1428 RepID=UPI000BF65456|nr:ATP-binding protein [Bacillus thuringiensis]PER40848.1 hypothetical protein CN472_28850 [Bacillus thuringiensis]HDX9535327.1 ATP-binding protein [Bacillus thuringiensis]